MLYGERNVLVVVVVFVPPSKCELRVDDGLVCVLAGISGCNWIHVW